MPVRFNTKRRSSEPGRSSELAKNGKLLRDKVECKPKENKSGDMRQGDWLKKGKKTMMTQDVIKNGDGSTPVTSVLQLLHPEHRRTPFVSNADSETIEGILGRIPRGTVSMFLVESVSTNNQKVKIQVIKPELCGVDDNSIRLLNGDPDKTRAISQSDEKALLDFLKCQGFTEEPRPDEDQEICARYFVRSTATSLAIQ